MKLNTYLLTALILSMLCMLVSCEDSSTTVGVELGNSNDETITYNSDNIDTYATTYATIINTIQTETVTTLSDDEYYTTLKGIIMDYETLLINLNNLTNNFDGSTEWFNSINSYFNKSKNYLDTLNRMEDTVPDSYKEVHSQILYCVEHYTSSIYLIKEAVSCYIKDDTQNGDNFMIQATNYSDLANKQWANFRGYGIEEYTGETLPTQNPVSYPVQSQEVVVSNDDNEETYTLISKEAETTKPTNETYNDGYKFGGDNVFIYTN